EIAGAAHDTDISQFRPFLACEILQNPFAERGGRFIRAQDLDLCDQSTVDCHGPTGFNVKGGNIETGLFLQFATQAPAEVDLAVDNDAGVGRAAGKIASPSVERVCAHDAE